MKRRFVEILWTALAIAGVGFVALALAADRIGVGEDSTRFGGVQIAFVLTGAVLLAAGLVLRHQGVETWLRAALPGKKTSQPLRAIGIQVFVGATIAVALTEVVIRLTMQPYRSVVGDSLEYEPSIFSRHVLAQHEKLARGSNETWPINALGYRGEAFDIEKEPGSVRIVFLGGSQVFDPNASGNQDWPHRVQDLLADAGHNVEVVNAGIPGHASFDALGRLYSEVWMLEPDYVVLDSCWNDIKYFTQLTPSHSLLRNYEPYTGDPRRECIGGLDCLLGFSEVYLRLRYLYLRKTLNIDAEGVMEDSDIQSSFGEIGPEQYRLNVELFVDASRDIGATPILIIQPRLVSPDNSSKEREVIRYDYVSLDHGALVEAFASCDRAIESVSTDKGVDTLDLSSKLSGQADLFSDHIHLTDKGSEVVAQAVAGYLETLLQR
jgi:lysophospholipase L1-like esterase